MPGTYPDYLGTRALLALATGNLMYSSGRQDFTPYMPLGGTTAVDVYNIYEVTVYNA
jgi:hypothetical protein